MKKLLGLMGIFCLLCCTSSAAETDSLWSRTFGGASADYCYSVIQTADGGYALAGATASFHHTDSSGQDYWLVRLNEQGDSLWSNAFGSADASDFTEECYAVVENADGTFALGGYTEHYGSGGPDDFWWLKTDANGDSIDSDAFGGTFADQAWDMIGTSDDGYCLVGYTKSFSGAATNKRCWILKLDSAGDSVWADTSGSNTFLKNDEAYSVVENSDGDYVIAGCSNSPGTRGGYDFYVANKDSADGTTHWVNWLGGASDEYCYDIIETSDGGFALAGYTKSFGAGNEDFWLLKLDSSGDSVWAQTYGGTLADICYSVIENSNGEFVLAGRTSSFGPGNASYWVVKTSATGDSLWSQTFGASGGDDVCRDIIQTTGGDYILAGYDTDPDFWAIKMGSRTTTTTGVWKDTQQWQKGWAGGGW